MYGAIFWIVMFLIIAPSILCCVARRIKFWTYFCSNVVVASGDIENTSTAANKTRTRPLLGAIIVVGSLLPAYMAAAAITAVYVSAGIDLFPGDTYAKCGETNPSKTDGSTSCNWDYYSPPAMQEVTFKSDDRETDLVGWWLPAAENGDSAATTSNLSAVGALLYHHGSGLNIAAEYREKRYDWFLSQGISVFVYDYPAYGKSGGTSSEDSLNAAAKGALTWLMAKTKRPEAELLQLGRSLGAAVAVRLASDLAQDGGRVFRGTIIQSAFSSYADAIAAFFPTTAWAAKGAVGSLFDSLASIPNAKGCLFQYHGVDDEWVPVSQGEALHAAATGFNQACSPKLYKDTDVLHDAAMTGSQKAAIADWMRSDLGMVLWT